MICLHFTHCSWACQSKWSTGCDVGPWGTGEPSNTVGQGVCARVCGVHSHVHMCVCALMCRYVKFTLSYNPCSPK